MFWSSKVNLFRIEIKSENVHIRRILRLLNCVVPMRTCAVCAFVFFLFSSISYGFVHELYSESLYIKDAGFISDSYVRFRSQNGKWLDSYFGVRMQLQEAGALKRYYENRLIPFLGVQKVFSNNFLALAEVRGLREIDEDRQQLQSEGRLGLLYSNIWFWRNPGTDSLFSEIYGESFWIPRADPRLMNTVWVKLGFRYNLTAKLMLDPHLEARSQRRDQEFRSGLRGSYQSRVWTASLSAYRVLGDRGSEYQALLQVGGLL